MDRNDSHHNEVQGHGFVFQDKILMDIYGATEQELRSIQYTSIHDLPAMYNRRNGVNLSIKTTGSNTICMGDLLRLYDVVNSGEPIHLIVISYKQIKEYKKITEIIEFDLTSAKVFGTLTREELVELDQAVKQVPQKRNPTPEEHAHMYSIKKRLQPFSNAGLNIKCNSTQSRLQCSLLLKKIQLPIVGRFQKDMEIYSPARMFK